MGRRLAIKLGCDPEVFVSPKGRKNFVTAHGLIPGTKYDPHNILEGMVQVDGCALEFGITPANTSNEWFTRIKAVLGQLRLMVPEHDLHIQPVAEFEKRYWDRHVPEPAKMLGCEPDWNAWTGEINPPPDITAVPNTRTAAGHIHIGWCNNKDPMDENHLEDCRAVVKQLDYYLGIFTLLYDQDATRRKLYGKAGAFRPKPYGCEYRVPSNMWLTHDPLIDLVYYSCRKGVTDLSEGKSAEKTYGSLAQDIINESVLDWPTSRGIDYSINNQYKWFFNKSYARKADVRGPQWTDR